MLKDLVLKNRSFRRFFQNAQISGNDLLELIELARFTATGANKQSLRFKICNSQTENEIVFSNLSWAGYLPEWSGPVEGERPAAYIIILNDKSNKVTPQIDVGLASQSILLGAVEKGIGGCMFASINRDRLITALNISTQHEICLVIALGKPKEEVIIVDVVDGDIKYWRDKDKVHHVPKRKMEDLLI